MKSPISIAAALGLFVFLVETVEAQTPLTVGRGAGEIGLIETPNEPCRGPTAVAPGQEGRLAVLDAVNWKIALIGGTPAQDVPLPDDLLKPVHLLVTTRGYFVVDAGGEVFFLDPAGALRSKLPMAYDSELGAPRILVLVTGELVLEDLRGQWLPIRFTETEIGEPIRGGAASPGAYRPDPADPNSPLLLNAAPGQLAALRITSSFRIVDARTLWSREDEGAIVAVQEARRLPEEASFVRLIFFDRDGQPSSEAYIGPEAFPCDTRRPFARLTDGRVVSLEYDGAGQLSLAKLHSSPWASPPQSGWK